MKFSQGLIFQYRKILLPALKRFFFNPIKITNKHCHLCTWARPFLCHLQYELSLPPAPWLFWITLRLKTWPGLKNCLTVPVGVPPTTANLFRFETKQLKFLVTRKFLVFGKVEKTRFLPFPTFWPLG